MDANEGDVPKAKDFTRQVRESSDWFLRISLMSVDEQFLNRRI